MGVPGIGPIISSGGRERETRFRRAATSAPGWVLSPIKSRPATDAENFVGEVHFEPPFTLFDHLVGAGEKRARSRSAACARAASGHAAAATPSSVMKWRRLRSSMGSYAETRASLQQAKDAREGTACPWGRPESFYCR